MFFKQTFYSININRVSYEREESVHCDEDNFITQGKIIPDSFDSTEHNDILDAKTALRKMKIQCPEKIIVDHLNINSIRNKFDALSFITDTNTDILLISETKLDDSFSSAQFRLNGFCTPYRSDRNSKGGALLLCFREDIPSRFLNSGSTCNIANISIEINLRKRKWLLTSCFNPNKYLISSHLDYLNNILDKYSKSYENLVFMGDFNVMIEL